MRDLKFALPPEARIEHGRRRKILPGQVPAIRISTIIRAASIQEI
jgi:hypothetical protein